MTILPKVPAADDEYTPAQRPVIDCGIAKGLEDIKKGRIHGHYRGCYFGLRAHARRRKKSGLRKSS